MVRIFCIVDCHRGHAKRHCQNNFSVKVLSLLDYQGKGDKNVIFMIKKSGRSLLPCPLLLCCCLDM